MQENIKDFIRKQSPITDIFCLQEVIDSSKLMFESLLPNFKSIYAYKYVYENEDFPEATYIKENLEIVSSKTLLDDILNAGLGIYVGIKGEADKINICNFHGLAQSGKLDNPQRLQQSRGLIDFFNSLDGRKIIGGDFNVLPDTDSIKLFKDNGYINLIKEFNIKTTRNHFALDRYPGRELYYSDYVFISPDVKVKNFEVINNEVSDHLPMVLDI